MNTKLKPCPCCGAEPEFDLNRGYRIYSTGDMGNAVTIYCTKCPCDMTLCHEDYPGDSAEFIFDQLAEAWNKQTIRAPHPGVEGMLPVVLYFKTEKDRQDLIDAVQNANPRMKWSTF